MLALGGRHLARASHLIGIPAVAASFGLSLVALAAVVRDGAIAVPLYRFVDARAFVIDPGLYLDQLAVLLLPLVTGVSCGRACVFVALHDRRPALSAFFAVLALFTFAMTLLVTSDNLLVTYMCWELMGICSYLLISHYAERPAAGQAATKAFLVTLWPMWASASG